MDVIGHSMAVNHTVGLPRVSAKENKATKPGKESVTNLTPIIHQFPREITENTQTQRPFTPPSEPPTVKFFSMGRIKNFVRGVASGYVALAVNVVYTMASIPLALNYLSKEKYGLWALIMQISGYLALSDFGMSTAVIRSLAECKDDKNAGTYGSILKTGQVVFTIQGCLIGGVGVLLGIVLPEILQIDPALRSDFTFFVGAQAAVTAAHFFIRMLGVPFWCHQRYDVTNLTWAVGYVLSFAVLWIGFEYGLGLWAMLLANIAEFILSGTVSLIASARLGFWPKSGAWGKVSWPLFREIFQYGKDLFLMAIGMQLVAASQVIVVTRALGLEAAAVWAVCTKLFTLAQQVVGRIFDFSLGAFSEMLVRNERERLEKRYKEILAISVSASICIAAAGALCNSGFVELWTWGRIAWSPWNDLLMGILLMTRIATRCHADFIGLTKDIGSLKYLYLFEGVAFVTLSVLLAPRGGFPAVILLAIALDVLFVGSYGMRRVAKFFGQTSAHFARSWMQAPTQLAAALLITGGLFAFATAELSGRSKFILSVVFTAVVGPLFLWAVGLDRNLRAEIGAAAARIWNLWRPAGKQK